MKGLKHHLVHHRFHMLGCVAGAFIAVLGHYMLSELEHRLDKCRDAFASALDEFDEACAQHHEEMETIRPALLQKLGSIPVVEMYRQACIRCKKAKRWADAREWAERGIRTYGDNAARPEEVLDLRRRLVDATAKIDSAERREPRQTRPRAARSACRPRELERFICTSCGTTFERPRTTGRKPQFCPDCRPV